MSATITSGSITITPTLVLSYESQRTSASRGHELLGGGVAVTMRPASLRTGTLELFFVDEATAYAAELAHRDSAVFTLDEPERPTAAMSYVVAPGGRITRTLDDESRAVWTVSVDYQEVTP